MHVVQTIKPADKEQEQITKSTQLETIKQCDDSFICLKSIVSRYQAYRGADTVVCIKAVNSVLFMSISFSNSEIPPRL